MEFQVRGVARFVKRAVRDAVGEITVAVFKLRDLHMIGKESEERGGASLLAGDGEPLVVTIPITRLEQRFTLLIRRAVKLLGAHLHPPAEWSLPFEVDRPIAEEIDLRACHRLPARGVRHPPLFFAAHVVLDEHGIDNPYQSVK